MTRDSLETGHSNGLRRQWPWLVLALLLIPAVWHVVDFEEDIDPEFPKVARPTFSRVPPSAYRLAEPGDTLDRIVLYFAAASVVLSSAGLVLNRGGALWPAGSALGLAALWYSATPGPAVDGWYGLGWRTIADPQSPPVVRSALMCGAIFLGGILGLTLVRQRDRLASYWIHSGANGTRWLWITGWVLVLARQFDLPGVEPQGYWPRWSMIGGLVAFILVILIELVPASRSFGRRWLVLSMGSVCWLALVVSGIWLTWYHRPLARLKE
ncbi:MAG TPA: protein tyrosine phosphatase, partial [Isosphaeraceae bacterium]|nr:protein tyrosine phosphatase [Isosphaeraceae bacterium]